MKKIFLLLFPVFIFGQKNYDQIGCTIKSFKTTCLENSKVISEIKYRYISQRYSPAIIERIYGRFEDLENVLSTASFKQNKIDFTCNENVIYDDKNDIFHAQKKDDNMKLYYLYDHTNMYGKKLKYKGTEDVKELKRIDLNDPKKYLILYNKDSEKDTNFEVTYNYYDSQNRLAYTFHQRGNEFDEYIYKYENDSLTVYKNGIIWKEDSSSQYEEEIEERTITQYNIAESYRFDGKNRPFLKESRFVSKNKICDCAEGYITKIEYWLDNRCTEKKILE